MGAALLGFGDGWVGLLGGVFADGFFGDGGFVEDGVEGFLFAELEVEVGEGAVFGHLGFEFFGAFATHGGDHGDAAVEFGFIDFDVAVVGDLLEDEEEFEFGLGFFEGALFEGFDVGFELGLGDAALHEVDGAALNDAVGLALGHLGGEFDGGVVDEVLADLVALGFGDVEVDAADELFAEGFAEFGFVFEAEGFEEVCVDDGEFEAFDVVDLDVDLDFFAGDFFLGVFGGDVGVEGAGFAGFDADEFGFEFGDFDAGDAAVGDDELGAGLGADGGAVGFEGEVADEEVFGFCCAFDGDESALLLAEVGHGLVDVGFGDFDFGFGDGDAVEVGEGEGGLDFDGEGVGDVAGFGEFGDGFDVIELGFAEDFEVVFGDGLFVGLADELAADLFFDFAGELLLDEGDGGLAGAEAGDVGLGADFFELFGELGFDAVAGDFDEDLFGGRAGVFDADGVLEFGVGGFGESGRRGGHGVTLKKGNPERSDSRPDLPGVNRWCRAPRGAIARRLGRRATRSGGDPPGVESPAV